MAPLAASRPHRTYKHSSVTRREERIALLHEVEVLRMQVRFLRRRSKQVDSPIAPDDDDDVAEFQRLATVVRGNDLHIAGLRGLLCGHTTSRHCAPLYRPLFLPKDPALRYKTLVEYHKQRLADTDAFMRRRCSGVNLAIPYSSHEMFQDPVTGDLCTEHFDVLPFPGIESVSKVFEALCFFSSNVEICLSEHLGNVTIREDNGEDEVTQHGGGFSSVRHVRSTTDVDATVEGRQAIFAQAFGADTEPDQYALVSIQPVDGDRLWVSRSHDRVYMKVTGMIRISKPRANGSVVMAKWMAFRLHRGRKASEQDVRVVLKENTDRWVEVIERVVWDRVYTNEVGPTPPQPL